MHEELEKTVPKMVENALAKKTAKFVWGYWLAVVGSIITVVSGYTVLAGDVKINTESRMDGGRYTASDHTTYAKSEREYIDNQNTIQDQDNANLKDDIAEIKDDIKYIRDNI